MFYGFLPFLELKTKKMFITFTEVYDSSNPRYACKSYLDSMDIDSECKTEEECLQEARWVCDWNEACYGFSSSPDNKKIKFCSSKEMKNRTDVLWNHRMKSSKCKIIKFMYIFFGIKKQTICFIHIK